MNPTLELKFDADSGDLRWAHLELADAWRAAQEEAALAYEHWRRDPGTDGYIVYRAAQDRADQAQEILAQSLRHPGRESGS